MASLVARKDHTRLPRTHASLASVVARCDCTEPLPLISKMFSRHSM